MLICISMTRVNLYAFNHSINARVGQIMVRQLIFDLRQLAAPLRVSLMIL